MQNVINNNSRSVDEYLITSDKNKCQVTNFAKTSIKMNIGDRVRLLHGREEGIVVAIKNNIIEIEIEDGFIIPASKNEIVVVAKEESERFQKTNDNIQKAEKKSSVFAEHGIFIALMPISQSTLELYLINNTDYTITLNLFQDQKTKFKGIYSHVFKPKTGEFINNVISSSDNLPEYLVQGLYFSDYLFQIKNPILKKIKVKNYIISGNQSKAPVIGKTGYLIQIDSEQTQIVPQQIKDSIEENIGKKQDTYKAVSPGKEVDLHIEKLSPSHANSSNSEILKIQLDAFETAMDSAIAAGQNEIRFIHGIGNGVLRSEIQKRLSKMKNIKFFEDSMKDRFGYGATLVKIR